jgi:hypothetical protein
VHAGDSSLVCSRDGSGALVARTGVPLAGDTTLLEALQAGIAGQLAVLDDASLTGTGQSSADVLEVPGLVQAPEAGTAPGA